MLHHPSVVPLAAHANAQVPSAFPRRRTDICVPDNKTFGPAGELQIVADNIHRPLASAISVGVTLSWPNKTGPSPVSFWVPLYHKIDYLSSTFFRS
jgi:hypothetical protein